MKLQKIQVKREVLADWLTALRSGEYNQCKSTLVKKLPNNETGYCCLGVKCQIENPEKFQKYFVAILDSVTVEHSLYTGYSTYSTEFSKFLTTKFSENHSDYVELLLTSLNDGGERAYSFINKYHLTQWCIDKNIPINKDKFFEFSFQNIAEFVEEILVEYVD